MMNGVRATLVMTLVACAGRLEGKAVDGLTGEPVAGLRIVANADDASVGMSCMAFDATTDEQGKFAMDGICLSQTGYRLKASDEDRWFVGGEVAKGAAAPVELQTWQAPTADGLFEKKDKEFSPITTAADARTVPVWDSPTEVVTYPHQIPDKRPLIEEGEFLVLVGKGNVEGLKVWPLIPSDTRKFGNADSTITMEPWDYFGVTFTSDTEFTRQTASFDASKVKRVDGANRVVAFVPASALPPGRYAMMLEGDRRCYVVDFGKAPSPRQAQADGAAAGG